LVSKCDCNLCAKFLGARAKSFQNSPKIWNVFIGSNFRQKT